MSLLPVLETDRFLLRPISLKDVDLMFAMDANPKVMQYIGHSRRARSKSEVRSWGSHRLAKRDGLGAWLGFQKKDKTFVGCYLLMPL